MPYYEFACRVCKVAFDIGGVTKLDTKKVRCVECGASRVKLTGYDENLLPRLQVLTDAIETLVDKVERLEDAVFEPQSSGRYRYL